MLDPSELPSTNPGGNVLLFEEEAAPRGQDTESLAGSIWTVSNGTKNPSRLSTATVKVDPSEEEDKENPKGSVSNESSDDEDEESIPDTKIIFDKEFDDYYEDRIHKSGSSMVFLSKTMGLLPAIWTEEDLEGEFKMYLNFYTFALYTCWVALFIITSVRIFSLDTSSEDSTTKENTIFNYYMNGTKEGGILYSSTLMKANLLSQWVSSLIIVSCGIFNSHVLAEIFFSLSGIDSALDMKEKQYTKINRKVISWCIFYILLWGCHAGATYYLLRDSKLWHLLYFFSDVASYGIPIVLDLQFIFICLSLRKRYRVLCKALHGKTKTWKFQQTSHKSSNILQNILQYRFDQIFEPKEEEFMKSSLSKPDLHLDPWMKEEPQGSNLKIGGEDPTRGSPKEEEHELISQLESFRCVYVDLGKVIEETNNMLSSSLFSHIVATNISLTIWLYLNMLSLEYFKMYIVFIGLSIIACLRTYLICSHAHKLKHESRKPVSEVCQVSSIDGSAKLERLLVKTASQMYYNQPVLSCGDYFPLGQKIFFLTLTASILVSYVLYRIFGFEFNFLLEKSDLAYLRNGVDLLKKSMTKDKS